jgi:hypothetical protein
MSEDEVAVQVKAVCTREAMDRLLMGLRMTQLQQGAGTDNKAEQEAKKEGS